MSEKSNSGGISFYGLLTIVLIVLKLTKTINWSWWLVLLPMYWWIPVALAFTILYAIYHTIKYYRDND